MDLYLDEPLRFEKTSALAQLGENTQQWGPKIVSELHKNKPFLSGFHMTLHLERLRPEQGYALGHITVSEKTDRTLSDQNQPGKAVKAARIPVVVEDFKLQPFDVFLRDKKAYPLTQERFTQELFNPAIFDSAQKAPPDRALTDSMNPPQSGGRSGGVSSLPTMEKVASGSVLQAVAPTLRKEHLEYMIEKVAQDSSLRAAIQRNGAVSGVLMNVKVAAARESPSGAELMETVRGGNRPTVVQFTKLASGDVKFKWANPRAYDPQEQVLPMEKAAQVAGPELSAMPPEASMTASSEKPAEEMLLEEPMEPITTFGEYKVEKVGSGNEVMGWCIPQLVKFTLDPTELCCFTNGSEYAVSAGMLGRLVGRGANLPEGEARGYGIFYFERQSKVIGTVPVTIKSTIKNPDGTTSLSGSDDAGQPVRLTKAKEIANITTVGRGDFLIPTHWKFLPLQGRIQVVTTSSHSKEKKAAPQRLRNTITIRCDRGVDGYSLSGPPLMKLARDQKEFLDRDGAEFVLACAGLSPMACREKLAEARGPTSDGRVDVAASFGIITPWDEVVGRAKVKVATLLSSVPDMRRDFLKEATTVMDPDTVDAMLAVNFINPENVSTFVRYLPVLENAVQKLADLLFAARMGLPSIEQDAVRKALFGLEEVVQGLKALETQEYS